jgi:hypothetical protein
MKYLILLLLCLVFSPGAHAQDDDRSYFGGGLRLGLGYDVIDYEQKISDTGTNFTSGATEISFLYLSYMYEWSPYLQFLAYGSLGTVEFDSSPSGNLNQTKSEMTGEVNLEARFAFDDMTQRTSWLPIYIIGINADYMTVVRAPQSIPAGYEYDQLPVYSPVVGLTTTLWLDHSAWRNTVKLGIPMFAGSGMDVRSGYSFLAHSSYTFRIVGSTYMGVEGVLSYLSLKMTEVSPVTSLDVDHTITQFSVGPRVFFTINF